jgi:predicted naringenin-chalcone synthase
MLTAMYPTIIATGTAVPSHTLDRDAVKTYIGRVFSLDERRLNAMMTVIDNAQIETRRSIFPVDYIVSPRSLAQKSVEYQEHAIRLGQEAADACLTQGGIQPSDVDLIITVSCTGFMIPSLDAHLIRTMGLRPDVRRLPITELGCAAGAMGAVACR